MAITLTATQRKSQLSILRAVIKASKQLEQSVKIAAGTSRQKRLALMIFHDLTNKFGSLYALCSAGYATGPEIIARSAFENFVDLLNLYRHAENYPSYLFYLSAEHQRSGLQAVLNTPDSPFSKSILDHSQEELGLTVQEMLAQTKAEMRQHKHSLTAQFRRPNREKSVRDRKVDGRVELRAKLAGKSHEYEAMYRLYSRPAHGDIGSMLNSFVSGGEFVWPPVDPPPSSLAVDLAIKMMVESGKLLCRKLRRPMAKFNTAEERYDTWAKRIYER